jgi:hypothetical protein
VLSTLAAEGSASHRERVGLESGGPSQFMPGAAIHPLPLSAPTCPRGRCIRSLGESSHHSVDGLVEAVTDVS